MKTLFAWALNFALVAIAVGSFAIGMVDVANPRSSVLRNEAVTKYVPEEASPFVPYALFSLCGVTVLFRVSGFLPARNQTVDVEALKQGLKVEFQVKLDEDLRNLKAESAARLNQALQDQKEEYQRKLEEAGKQQQPPAPEPKPDKMLVSTDADPALAEIDVQVRAEHRLDWARKTVKGANKVLCTDGGPENIFAALGVAEEQLRLAKGKVKAANGDLDAARTAYRNVLTKRVGPVISTQLRMAWSLLSDGDKKAQPNLAAILEAYDARESA